MGYQVAVVGATGNVGREILNILAERNFPIDEMTALASSRSRGLEVSFGERAALKVRALEDFHFKGIDIAFFAAGSKVSAQYAPKAAQAGAIVIDKTSHFRLDADVPLVVPEVNPEALENCGRKNIISSPNCVVVPLVVALKPLDQVARIKRVVASTYQSVSGAGRPHMDELYNQTRGTFVNDPVEAQLFPKPIAFNVIPHIDDFRSNGMTGEEEKIALETQKILGSSVAVFATCVRVPVFIGHSISVAVEFEEKITVAQARAALEKSPSVEVFDRHREGGYATPVECSGEDRVYVSRIRQDTTVPHGLGLWVVTDNLRKGAALNGVQIAERWVALISRKHAKSRHLQKSKKN